MNNKKVFWELLEATHEGDPFSADEPDVHYTVEPDGHAPTGTHFIVRHCQGESRSIGRIDDRNGHFDMALDVEVHGQPADVTYQELTFRDATEVLVSFLQEKDVPFVEGCDTAPGERVLTRAFGKLVPSWREWPKEPMQMTLGRWKSVVAGALVAESVAEDYFSAPEPAGTALQTEIGWGLRKYYSELSDKEVEDIFRPSDETAEAFAEEMENITGTRPPTIEETIPL